MCYPSKLLLEDQPLLVLSAFEPIHCRTSCIFLHKTPADILPHLSPSFLLENCVCLVQQSGDDFVRDCSLKVFRKTIYLLKKTGYGLWAEQSEINKVWRKQGKEETFKQIMTVIKSTVLWFKWNLEELSSCEVKDTLSTVRVLLLLLCITSAGPNGSNIVDNCGVWLHTLRRDRGTMAAWHKPLLIQSFGKIIWKMVQEAEAY